MSVDLDTGAVDRVEELFSALVFLSRDFRIGMGDVPAESQIKRLSTKGLNKMSKKKIGLALGSGAVRGYAIVPILKKLEKEGIEISAISGSSIGALIGAYYSLHGEVDSFMSISKNLTRKDFLKLVDLNNPKVSMIKGKKIKELKTWLANSSKKRR